MSPNLWILVYLAIGFALGAGFCFVANGHDPDNPVTPAIGVGLTLAWPIGVPIGLLFWAFSTIGARR